MLSKTLLFDILLQRKYLGRDACCMPKSSRETNRHASILLTLIIQPEHQKYYRSGFQPMTSPAEHSTKREKKRGKLPVIEIRGNIARNTLYLWKTIYRELFSSRLLNQGLAVRFDPPKDGNCPFSALCNQLTQIDIFRAQKTLREELVEYLQTHPDGADGFTLELFVGSPWDEYFKSMACYGTYGDHLTLQAAVKVFQIQIIVFSTLGPTATQIISPANGGDPLCTLHLDHFAEGDGEHYISLSDLSNGQEEHVPSQDNSQEENMPSPGNNQDEHMPSQKNGKEEHVPSPGSNQEEHVTKPRQWPGVTRVEPSQQPGRSRVGPR